jgi:hypothetical protein
MDADCFERNSTSLLLFNSRKAGVIILHNIFLYEVYKYFKTVSELKFGVCVNVCDSDDYVLYYVL